MKTCPYLVLLALWLSVWWFFCRPLLAEQQAQTIALQQIAASTSQIVRDSAAENARLDKQDERMEEMLEHMAGVMKHGGGK